MISANFPDLYAPFVVEWNFFRALPRIPKNAAKIGEIRRNKISGNFGRDLFSGSYFFPAAATKRLTGPLGAARRLRARLGANACPLAGGWSDVRPGRVLKPEDKSAEAAEMPRIQGWRVSNVGIKTREKGGLSGKSA
jgi:hypothetical protein